LQRIERVCESLGGLVGLRAFVTSLIHGGFEVLEECVEMFELAWPAWVHCPNKGPRRVGIERMCPGVVKGYIFFSRSLLVAVKEVLLVPIHH
jgi:hypothetical protein